MDADAPVVPVQPLALAAVEADLVGGAEDEVLRDLEDGYGHEGGQYSRAPGRGRTPGRSLAAAAGSHAHGHTDTTAADPAGTARARPRDAARDRHGNPEDLEAYLARLEDPERLAWQRPDEVVAALGLRPGDVACDVGVGPGYFALRIARVGRPGRARPRHRRRAAHARDPRAARRRRGARERAPAPRARGRARRCRPSRAPRS